MTINKQWWRVDLAEITSTAFTSERLRFTGKKTSRLERPEFWFGRQVLEMNSSIRVWFKSIVRNRIQAIMIMIDIISTCLSDEYSDIRWGFVCGVCRDLGFQAGLAQLEVGTCLGVRRQSCLLYSIAIDSQQWSQLPWQAVIRSAMQLYYLIHNHKFLFQDVWLHFSGKGWRSLQNHESKTLYRNTLGMLWSDHVYCIADAGSDIKGRKNEQTELGEKKNQNCSEFSRM